jgi:hypothetical protein
VALITVVINKKELKKLYYEEEYTQKELSDHYNCSLTTIKNRFNEFDMDRRENAYENLPGPTTEEGKKKVAQNLPDESVWELSEKGREAVSIANQMKHLQHGLYASIPIRCKGDDCPYSDQCYLLTKDKAPYGEPCPIEIATIEQLVERYAKDLDISMDNMVDISQLKDLVDIDISIARCNKKLAVDADIVEDIVVAVTEDGRSFTKPEINKAYDLQDKLLKRKKNILNDLNATRKAKAKQGVDQDFNVSSFISELRERAQKNKEKTIDVSEEIEEIEEVVEE